MGRNHIRDMQGYSCAKGEEFTMKKAILLVTIITGIMLTSAPVISKADTTANSDSSGTTTYNTLSDTPKEVHIPKVHKEFKSQPTKTTVKETLPQTSEATDTTLAFTGIAMLALGTVLPWRLRTKKTN